MTITSIIKIEKVEIKDGKQTKRVLSEKETEEWIKEKGIKINTSAERENSDNEQHTDSTK